MSDPNHTQLKAYIISYATLSQHILTIIDEQINSNLFLKADLVDAVKPLKFKQQYPAKNC